MFNCIKFKNCSPKKLLIIYVLAIISIIFISVVLTYNWQKNSSTKIKNQNNKNIIFTPTLKPTPTIEMKDFSVIENIFKEVSDNTIKFNSKRDNVNIYNSESINLQEYFPVISDPEFTDSVSLQINVYLYQPGAKFNGAYEGGTWVVNLDEWKQWLQGLNLGENKVYKICNDWGCNKFEQSQTVIAKKINSGKYYVADGGFKPAATLNRNYTSFNSKNNTIIDVRLDYYAFGRYSDKNSIEMLGIFSKIESLLP